MVVMSHTRILINSTTAEPTYVTIRVNHKMGNKTFSSFIPSLLSAIFFSFFFLFLPSFVFIIIALARFRHLHFFHLESGSEREKERVGEVNRRRGSMEWEKQQQQQPQPQHSHPPTLVDGGEGVGVGAAGMYVKVMTDEQLEVLRTQIAVYATICEQLVDMHKAVTAQQDLAGVRLGNPYCDPLVASIGHKITARQRWTPTPIQLQKLEQIFDQGTGTPSKQKIKDITSELSLYGQISETNVYNWFQNRRARSKRKQLNNTASNGGETEVDVADAESPKEKKTKPQNFQPVQDGLALGAEDQPYLQSSGMDSVGPQSNKVEPVFLSDGNVKPLTNSGQLSFLESMLETQRIDHFIGKMEISPSYDPYHSGEDYGMTG